jgi:hypothetical protein
MRDMLAISGHPIFTGSGSEEDKNLFTWMSAGQKSFG